MFPREHWATRDEKNFSNRFKETAREEQTLGVIRSAPNVKSSTGTSSTRVVVNGGISIREIHSPNDYKKHHWKKDRLTAINSTDSSFEQNTDNFAPEDVHKNPSDVPGFFSPLKESSETTHFTLKKCNKMCLNSSQEDIDNLTNKKNELDELKVLSGREPEYFNMAKNECSKSIQPFQHIPPEMGSPRISKIFNHHITNFTDESLKILQNSIHVHDDMNTQKTTPYINTNPEEPQYFQKSLITVTGRQIVSVDTNDSSCNEQPIEIIYTKILQTDSLMLYPSKVLIGERAEDGLKIRSIVEEFKFKVDYETIYPINQDNKFLTALILTDNEIMRDTHGKMLLKIPNTYNNTFQYNPIYCVNHKNVRVFSDFILVSFDLSFTEISGPMSDMKNRWTISLILDRNDQNVCLFKEKFVAYHLGQKMLIKFSSKPKVTLRFHIFIFSPAQFRLVKFTLPNT